jgi:hypothetical protein
MAKLRRVTVRLEPEQAHQMEDLKLKGMTFSQVIRHALNSAPEVLSIVQEKDNGGARVYQTERTAIAA